MREYDLSADLRAVSEEVLLIAPVTTLAIAVIVLGMFRCKRHGITHLGLERAVVIALYIVALVLIL